MSWQQVLMILGAVAVVFLALMPLAVYFSFQVKQRPAVSSVLRGGLSEMALEYFDDSDEVLTKLGFERPAYLSMEVSPVVTAYVAVRANRALGQTCVQTAMRIPGKGTFRSTAFTTEYDGTGGSVTTGNSRLDVSFSSTPARQSVAAKKVQDQERLYRMHLAHERRRPSTPVRRVTAPGYEARLIRVGTEQSLQEMMRRGHLRQAGDGEYWPTARGAFAMAMERLPHRTLATWWHGRGVIRSLLAEADGTPMQSPSVERVVEVTDVSSATTLADTVG